MIISPPTSKHVSFGLGQSTKIVLYKVCFGCYTASIEKKYWEVLNMKCSIETVELIRDLATTTIKIAGQEKFDVASICNYGPYISRITAIKETVSAIPDEFREADAAAIKAIAGSLIDSFFIIRDQLRAQAVSVDNYEYRN